MTSRASVATILASVETSERAVRRQSLTGYPVCEVRQSPENKKPRTATAQD
jgi:hypothetical protein